MELLSLGIYSFTPSSNPISSKPEYSETASSLEAKQTKTKLDDEQSTLLSSFRKSTGRRSLILNH